jgi:hypothetical protein
MQVEKLGIKPPSSFLLDCPGSWDFFLLIITSMEPYPAWLIMLYLLLYDDVRSTVLSYVMLSGSMVNNVV